MRLMQNGVLALWLIAGARFQAVSSRAECPAVQPGEPVAFCQTDPKPLRRPDQAPPAYPPVLRQAGVEGNARIRFVLDSTGRVRHSTIETLESTHRIFQQALVLALDTATFEPPSHRGAAVAARVELAVHFAMASVDSGPVRMVWDEERTDSGYRWRIGQARIPRTTPVPLLAKGERDAVIRAVILATPIPTSAEPDRALCIELPPEVRATALDQPTLAALRLHRATTVPSERCPPTYASWIRSPSTRKRPPGALDPDFITVGGVDVWTADVVRIPVRTGRGTGGVRYVCDATRDTAHPAGWRVTCYERGRWVS